LSIIFVPMTTSLSLGEYPEQSGRQRWLFLAGKLALILVILYCATCYVTYHGCMPHGLLVGAILALRWAIVDQRRRCPICLRLLTNPVRIGQCSQTFLSWYGTEFVCPRGHGLLHVPEISNSAYSRQRWLTLDRSWHGLFGRPFVTRHCPPIG
jgi:hypothetical protein